MAFIKESLLDHIILAFSRGEMVADYMGNVCAGAFVSALRSFYQDDHTTEQTSSSNDDRLRYRLFPFLPLGNLFQLRLQAPQSINTIMAAYPLTVLPVLSADAGGLPAG